MRTGIFTGSETNMTKNELMEGLNEAKELLSDRIPVIDAWIAVKALTEIIARLEACDAAQMTL